MSPSSGPRTVLLCTLLALLAWSGSVVRAGFSYDDREVIEGNAVVEGTVPWSEALRRDYWAHRGAAGHFRPTASWTLRMDHALWGADQARGWHVTNVLLHAACVAVLGLLLLLLGPVRSPLPGAPSDPLPWFGLAVFAVHPVLADSVAWISGRTSMLSTLPGLVGALGIAALLVPHRRASGSRLALVAVLAALGVLFALLGKEDGIVFVAAYGLLGLRHSRAMSLATLAGSAAGLVAWGWLRTEALGSPLPEAIHAPLAGEPLPARLLVSLRAVIEGLRISALPAGYPPSYEGSSLLVGSGVTGVLLPVLGAVLLGGLLGTGLRALASRREPLVGASCLLVVAALTPMLQIVPAGALFAPRFLYLPLACGAPILHALWVRLPLGPALRRGLLAAFVAASIAGAWQRATVYADRGSFVREVLEHEPGDVRAWNDLGLWLEESGDLAGARSAWEGAAALDPSYGRPWSNLGRLELEADDLPAAERAFRRAVDLGRGNPVARCNLGSLLLRSDRAAEAADLYRTATHLAPGMLEAWRGLGRALHAGGDQAGARAALRRALEISPADPRALQLLQRLDP